MPQARISNNPPIGVTNPIGLKLTFEIGLVDNK